MTRMGNQDLVSSLAPAFAAALERLGLSGSPDFSHPAVESHGDVATNIALQLYGSLGAEQKSQYSSPRQLAEAIADEVKSSEDVDRIEVAGPGFINIFFSNKALLEEVQRIVVDGDKYGSSDWGKGKLWLIEHTSPNPNKAMHLGHLRNNVLGMSLANIWEFLGVSVVRDAVDNNRGIAIAKLMWGFLRFAGQTSRASELSGSDLLDYWYDHREEWLTPELAGKRPDRFMDELYAKASEDFKNPEVEQTVRQMVVDWENHDAKNWALWETVLDYVYEGQRQTLDRLGSKWDKVWHEHEHYESGKQFVQQGLEKGVFQQLEDGAILTNLEEFGLPDTIVQKSDGTSLYITQDLALTNLKKQQFHPDKLFWVIGPEQSLALKQMFAVCEQLGIGKVEDFTHIPYGYMSIKGQGKMSSRLGNVIYIDELIDSAKAAVLEKMDQDRVGQEVEQTAEAIAVGAVKYSILKVGRMTNTAFDFETSLALDGDSGPYLQYTHARCHSVLKDAEIVWSEDTHIQLQPEEQAVVRWLYRFPEIVMQAGQEYSPSDIAGFLFLLAQRFNAFYNQHSILNAEDEITRQFRLLLTAATAQVLANGLSLLGIEPVERM